jgi:drug/metabolite transporter (DMT)-like permease
MPLSPENIARPLDHHPLLGMRFAFFGYFCFSVQDTLMSLNSQIYAPLQLLWLNALVTLIMLLAYLFVRKGVAGLRTVFHSSNIKLQILRGLIMAISFVSVFYGLQHVPLPNFYVLIFMGPLLAVSLSGLFLKEPIGRGRMIALLIGFCGLLVALQPGHEGFNIYSLLVVFSALLFASTGLMTRYVSRLDAATTVVFYPMAITVVVMAVPVLLTFKPIAPEHLLPCLLAGVFSSFAFYLNANAYRHAPVYLLAPCQFLQFLWGTLAHAWINKTLPETHVWLGAALIIGSNLWIVYMQMRHQKKIVP